MPEQRKESNKTPDWPVRLWSANWRVRWLADRYAVTSRPQGGGVCGEGVLRFAKFPDH
uniref:Uncharacterized protein n=1 Tax=mine drainage metagenome TaxID=410659 RepID=E6Q8U6_9ZZZZ